MLSATIDSVVIALLIGGIGLAALSTMVVIGVIQLVISVINMGVAMKRYNLYKAMK